MRTVEPPGASWPARVDPGVRRASGTGVPGPAARCRQRV